MKHKILIIMSSFILLVMTSIHIYAQDQEGPPASIGLELVAEGLTSPIDLEQPADDSGRMFIADRTGMIYVLDADGQLLEEPLLDIQSLMVELNEGYDERGLLGFALHPDFANNGRLFVYYSAPLQDGAPSDWDHTSHLSEFTVSSDNDNHIDVESEQVIMMIDQPQLNHNGGDIAFGDDGYLYIPLGDGGGANDDDVGHTQDIGNGQDLTKLLGKILRIDVDNGDPYSVPQDNPFVDGENVHEEIWAYGFRNPWRMSFDSEYGLFVADLGQNVWEEVHIVHSGQNYGWNIQEGTHCFSAETPGFNPLECERVGDDGEALQQPIIEYSHQVGISIIGGYVYRGDVMPAGLQGTYVFGDWSTTFSAPNAQIFVATPPPSGVESHMWNMQTLEIANTGSEVLDRFILSFGRDNQGELYVLTSDVAGPTGETGKVWRIVPADDI